MGPVHGIPGDVILGLVLAVFGAFCLAMIWGGLVIAATEPVPPRYRARHRRQPG